MKSRWRPCALIWMPWTRRLTVRSASDETRARSCGAGAEDAGAIGRTRGWRASLQRESGAYCRGAEDFGSASLICVPSKRWCWKPMPEKARAIGRAFLGLYLTLPNYTNNFLRLGFDEGDFKDGGSNKLIDAIIAWGDLDAIRNADRRASCGGRGPCLHSGADCGSQGVAAARVAGTCGGLLPF